MDISKLETSWTQLEKEFEQPYFKKLSKFVDEEYQKYRCFPQKEDIFNAFELCPFDKVKVVIIGQDPYSDENQAHGLSFSVKEGFPLPSSLHNIFKEIENDRGTSVPASGNLTRWAKQGVLLLNTILTVREDTPLSHKDEGWENFTDAVIKVLNDSSNPIVFLLWGKYAHKKAKIIKNPKHCILKSVHPACANSGGWFPSHHFLLTNMYLLKNGIEEVKW